MASLGISHFQFFETADRQFTPFFCHEIKMKENGYILLLDSHTSDLNIRLTNIDVSLFSPLHMFVILGSSGINGRKL
jgi:hypothetical protein